MSTETAAFERAAIFRVSLARYLELPVGTDPENVGITLGPNGEPLIAMPLSTAERLLRDAAALRGELLDGVSGK